MLACYLLNIYIYIYTHIICKSFALLNRLYLTLSNHLDRSTTSSLIAHLAAILHVTFNCLSSTVLSEAGGLNCRQRR